MRPSVDVPWALHGQIKDHANTNDLDIEEAYIDLLQDGLESTRESEPKPDLSSASKTDVTFIERSTATHGEVCTFHQYGLGGSLVFRSEKTMISHDRLEQILAEVQQFASIKPNGGSFTVQQRNGMWIGEGLSTFYDTLRNQQERYKALPDDFELQTHHSEAALFVSTAPSGAATATRGPSALTITAQPAIAQDSIRQFRIAFTTSGVPIDPQEFDAFGDRIAMDLSYGQHRDPSRIEIPRNSGVRLEIEPVKRITEFSRGKEWVTGLIVENPFYQDTERFVEFLDQGIETGEIDDPSRLASFVAHDKLLQFHLLDHHPPAETYQYVGLVLGIEGLDHIRGSGFRAVNLHFAGTYLD